MKKEYHTLSVMTKDIRKEGIIKQKISLELSYEYEW